MDTLSNHTFIITGAASGIGRATARLLHTRGAKLALWDQNADALATVAGELGVLGIPLDVTSVESVQAAMAQTIEHLGAVNSVIHCAGILNAGLFTGKPIDSHRRVVEVNLFGTMNVAHAALPHLGATRGSLVMIASASAFYGSPEYAAYGATKAAVLGFAQALRVEYPDVHIGVVCPLFVASPMLEGYNGDTRMIRSRSPFFNLSPPDTIAPYILRGIERRQFMIFPGWRTRLLFWMSRYASFAMHPLTQMTYRQGSGKG